MEIAKIIAVIVIILIAIICGGYYFIKLPKDKKVANIKEWLKYAVAEAEKALGSGTGQLKLRMVYDMAVKQFSWIVNFISFETFSAWVDEALEWLNNQLAENEAAQNYIENK